MSSSDYRIENTSIKTKAVDLSDDRQASFDLEASFTHTYSGTAEKLVKIFRLSQLVNEEIEHLFVDAKNLPQKLRIKMPEFLNFVENFRQNIVNRGYVSDKTYEKREARDATKMLSSFLFNVLKDN